MGRDERRQRSRCTIGPRRQKITQGPWVDLRVPRLGRYNTGMTEPTAKDQVLSAPHARLDRGLEGRYQLTLSRSGLNECFDVSLEACPSPICHCPIVKLVCTPVDEGVPGDVGPRTVSLDVFSQSAESPHAGTGLFDEEVACLVAASLDSEQWRWLRQWLTQEKRKQMQGVDLGSLDISFEPAVLAEGALVGYSEVFPFAEQPCIETDSGKWIVDDQYCIRPGCRCADCVLSFFPLPDEGGAPYLADHVRPRERSLEQEVVVRYYLRRRLWKIEPPSALPLSATRRLVEALEQTRPDLTSFLAARQKQLRQLLKLSLATSRRNDPTPSRAALRIGRNDPCHCGSGRKYKRCCGR